MTGKERFERLEKATDLPLALLALLIVPALVLEERSTSEILRTVAHAINWIVWLAFCTEYVGKLAIASERPRIASQRRDRSLDSLPESDQRVLPSNSRRRSGCRQYATGSSPQRG